jgi:ectoine hydroxylase-related dioxygenase (phytanoyl-CoA dioxygenase family)
MISSLRLIKYKSKNLIKKIFFRKKKITNKVFFKTAEELNKDGYTIIKDFLKIDECKVIINDINKALEKEKKSIISDNLSSDQRLFGFQKLNYIANKFYINEDIKNVGSNYLNLFLDNAYVLANRVQFINGNEGSGGGWHRDNYNKQFKAMIYLTDVSQDNGPLEIIIGSHKIYKMITHSKYFINYFPNTRFKNEDVQRIIYKEKNVKRLTGTAGTLILFDGSLIHRGCPLISGTRYALTSYYYPQNQIHNYLDVKQV